MAKTEEVKKLNILDVAQQLGMSFKRVGHGSYAWEEHDSFIISTSKNIYSWFSKDKHGDVIDLVRTVKEYQTGQPVSFKEAKRYLETGEFEQANIIEQPRPTFSYYLGQYETQDMTKARDYLRQERGLSDETIDHFIDQGLLAQATKKTGSIYEPVIVFKTLDKAGEVTGASLQGTVENRELHDRGRLKQLMRASDGLSGMTLDIGQPKRLVFAESPIDLMSYYQLKKDQLSDVRLVAMDGLKEGTVSRHFVELRAEMAGVSYKIDPKLTPSLLAKTAQMTDDFRNGHFQDTITLAVDNDEAGRQFVAKLQNKGIPVTPDLPPIKPGENKADWNDYLKNRRYKNMDKAQEKSLERTQGIDNTRGELLNRDSGFLDEDSSGSAPQPAVDEPQPDFPASIPLHFTIDTAVKSSHNIKDKYRYINDKELRKLNPFTPNLQRSAQVYLERFSGAQYTYFYKDGQDVRTLQVEFQKKNWMHLTGIFPIYKDKLPSVAEQFVEEIASGRTTFDNIAVGTGFLDKVQILPSLEEVQYADAFVFDDLSDVEKFGRLRSDKAIRSDNKQMVLALRTDEEVHFPASLLKPSADLNIQMEEANEEKTILGVYRNRDGVIDQLSINEDYIKDGGAEMMAIMQNNLFEKEGPDQDLIKDEVSIEQGQMSLDNSLNVAEMTRLMDTIREVGRAQVLVPEGVVIDQELAHLDQLLTKFEGDIDLVMTDLMLNDLIDKDSDGYRDWVEDKVFEAHGVGWADVANGKLSQDEFSDLARQTLNDLVQKRASTLIKKQLTNKPQPTQEAPQEALSEPQKVAELIANNDTKGLAEHMKAGIKTYLNSDQYKDFLAAMAKLPNYSINNVMLLKAQKQDVSAVASFNVWKKQFGRSVNKGAKALRIWAPMTFQRKDPETGKPVLDENGKPVTYTRFKLTPVFDVSQTNGREFPRPINELEGTRENYNQLYLATKNLANQMKVDVSFSPETYGARGYYNSETSQIVLKSGMSGDQTLKTFFHELAHAYLHNKERMADNPLTKSQKELQAESLAYVMCSHYGLDTSSYSFAYLANWSQDKQGLSDLEAQLQVVQKSAQDLLNRLDNILEVQQDKTKPQNKFEERLTQERTKEPTKEASKEVKPEAKKLPPEEGKGRE